jgi:acyl-CoA synthetase (AMP-forming)/AMP-acid ligase II
MFSDYLDRGAVVNPGGLYAIQGDSSITHAEARERSRRIARRLQAEGLGEGSKAAVYSANDITALNVITALFRLGISWVPLNPMASEDELAYVLNGSDCEFLLYNGAFAEKARQLLEKTPAITGSVGFGGDQSDAFERWLEGGDGVDLLPPPTGNVPLMLGGSGGTTGPPKIIPVRVRQILMMCWAFNAHMKEEEPPVYLMAPPLTHAAGVSAYPVLAEGGTLVIQEGVNPPVLFDGIERHKVTRMFLPPTAIYALLDTPGIESVDFSSLEHFIYAAAPMSADRLEQALGIFGPVMAQTYGQAEAPMICTCLTPRQHVEALEDESLRKRLKSCGQQSLVATVEIMDDDGRLLGPGERGEIVVRGDIVISGGYYKNPEASEESRRPGGWHGTGDIGYIDEDGFTYIVDRKKDMIITGGFNVYPNDVERVIWSLEQVTDCAVIGVPDPKWGEAVTAVIELKDGHSLTEEQVITVCKEQLGSIKAPKQVRFRDLPRSPNGKVLKRALRDEYWAGRERAV